MLGESHEPPTLRGVPQIREEFGESSSDVDMDDEEEDDGAPRHRSRDRRRSDAGGGKGRGGKGKGGMPIGLGIAIAAFILIASAGGTYFFMTKPPENQRLFQEGLKELSNGQYAFAVKTLNQAHSRKPDDSKVLLALARAYVGVDQVEKAWQCITEAQQLGAGLVAEPELASGLANYYRQRNQYQRAVELLRPLAAADLPNKKAELSDLAALWGDEAFRGGDYKTSLRCWEEVKELGTGSRVDEADSRLATVYAKMAGQSATKGDIDAAIAFYGKLNTLSPSASSLEQTALLYERQGKYELAIDQMRKATKLSDGSSDFNRKLASLMAKRGKEMLDEGDSDGGYGYLQQAQSLDPRIKAPNVTVRNMKVDVDNSTGVLRVSGEVWNPGPEPLNFLNVRGDLYDIKGTKVVWSKDQRLIDEFVPPLNARDTKPFEFVVGVPVRDDGTSEFRVYLDGTLYKSYTVGKGDKASTANAGSALESDWSSGGASGSAFSRKHGKTTETPAKPPSPAPTAANASSSPAPAPAPAPAPVPGFTSETPPSSGVSPEQKTLDDLDR
jgi:tetratricopeptide (TPR) repeat protein